MTTDAFLQFVVPPLAEDIRPIEADFGQDLLFDMEQGDFALDDTGDIIETDENVAWAQAALFAALTERYAHLALPFSYGIEAMRIVREPNRAVAIAEAQRLIREAVEEDPRVLTVGNFEVTADSGDTMTIRFVVTPRVGTPMRVSVSYG
jgi:hypothetical protein